MPSIKNCYQISVKVSDVKNAGTDDSLSIVLFGIKGGSDKIKLDNKNVDDFVQNKTGVFTINIDNKSISDLGFIYAIMLILDGTDGVHLDKITVDYADGAGTVKTSVFPFGGALGDKGDFDLTEARKVITLYADGYKAQTKRIEMKSKLGECWIVADSRSPNTSPFSKKYETVINEKVSRICEEYAANKIVIFAQQDLTKDSVLLPNSKYYLGPTNITVTSILNSKFYEADFKETIKINQVSVNGKLIFLNYGIIAQLDCNMIQIGLTNPVELCLLEAKNNISVYTKVKNESREFVADEDLPETYQDLYKKYAG